MTLDGPGGQGFGHYHTDLDVALLGSLREVCGADEGLRAIDDDALGMETSALAFAFGEAARVVKQIGQPRSTRI
jgi:hypothetical protein